MKLKTFLLCLVTVLAYAGCSDTETTPTAPDGSPLVYSGTVSHQGNSAHDLDMFDDGLLTVTLVDLDILLFDTTRGNPNNVVLGFGLGQRNDLGNCILTTNLLLARNEVRVYRLSKDNYCMSLFDPGALPEDALVGYVLQATITT